MTEIHYPHDEHPVYLEGKSRLEDLQSLMCSGQGIWAGLSDVTTILGDDDQYWEYVLRDAAHKIGELNRARQHPLLPQNCCLKKGRYVCITNKGRFVIGTRSKEDDKLKWDRDDIVLFFPYAGPETIDMLYENNLMNDDL